MTSLTRLTCLCALAGVFCLPVTAKPVALELTGRIESAFGFADAQALRGAPLQLTVYYDSDRLPTYTAAPVFSEYLMTDARMEGIAGIHAWSVSELYILTANAVEPWFDDQFLVSVLHGADSDVVFDGTPQKGSSGVALKTREGNGSAMNGSLRLPESLNVAAFDREHRGSLQLASGNSLSFVLGVPEPSTLALVAIGLLVVGWRMRQT